MKRFLSFVIAMVMILSLFPAMIFTSSADAGSNIAEPPLGDYYFDLKGEPVRIPTVAEGLKAQEGVPLWEGDVDFGASGAGIVTFVIKATGINTPVSLSRFLPTYTMQNTIDYWAIDNTWGGGNTGLDGVGTEHSLALNIPRDGTYVISIGRKVFGMAGAGNVLTISELTVGKPGAYENAYPLVNDNENAQLSLLSISKGNPTFTAYFYDEDGNKIGEATKEYPKAQEANDPQTTKKTTCLTVDEMFALTGKEAPAKDAQGGYKYVLQWVDSEGNPVDAVYKNMNLFASFVPVAANQAEVTFVDASDKIISMGYVEKGSTAEFTGAVPTINTTATTEHVFVGWATEKGGEVVDLATYTITEDTTFYPVFTEKTLPVITMFENPVSTTFGTQKNLLPGGFTATVGGLTGYTLLLKIDGIPYGETAKWGGIRPIVHATDGKDKDPVWCGNWIMDSYKTNSYVFESNGYYLYYFPFRSVVNELGSEKTVAGVSALNSFTVFDKSGALGDDGAKETTTDENITVTLVGMVEGNIVPFDVVAKKDDDILATKKTTASINMLGSVNNAGWAKLDTAFDLFGDRLGCTDTSYIKHWTNDAGDINDYILTEKLVRPVYGTSVLITVAPAGDTAYGIKEYAVDVTLGAETVDSAEIVLEYNKDAFTNPRLFDGTVLEECPEGAILNLAGTNTANVLFDISENAIDGTYSFNADGTCDDAPAKTTGAVSIKVTGQQDGQYYEQSDDQDKLVRLPSNNDEGGLKETEIWSGHAALDNAGAVTLVFRATGIEEGKPVKATALRMWFTKKGRALRDLRDEWVYTNAWGAGSDDGPLYISMEKDGYYYVYLSKKALGVSADRDLPVVDVSKVSLFATDGLSDTYKTGVMKADNDNADAKVQLVAIVKENLQPTVTFIGADGNEICQYTKAYTTLDNTATSACDPDQLDGRPRHWAKGNIITVAEAFEATGYNTPVKASTEYEAYEFIGWVDENGNDITNAPVYKAQRIYANYKTIESTTSTVTFMNDGVEFGKCEKILLNAYATAPEGTPVREGTLTGEYTFKGWSLETDGEVIDLENYPITEDLTLYASYEYNDVTFTVTYMDGTEEIGTETVVRSKKAVEAPTMKRKFDSYSYDDGDWHNLEKQKENNLGKQYYDFVAWTNEDGSAVDLTNTQIQSDLTVYAKYEAKDIVNWCKVEWRVQKGVNENRITAQWIAEGDSTYPLDGWAYNYQPLHNTADEHYWYTRNGWDQDTTCVTGNMFVYPHYDLVPIDMSPLAFSATVGGKVTEEHVLLKSTNEYTSTNPKSTITFLIKVTGASKDNPVTVGGLAGSFNSCGTINSNAYVGNAPLKEVTEDGYYYVTLGGWLMNWNSGNLSKFSNLSLSRPNAPCGVLPSADASGEASYEVCYLEGNFNVTVRYYDESGAWISTAKTADYSTDPWSSKRGSVPTPAELFKGELPEDFLYWADEDGNEVTYVTDNMDLHAVCKHVHTYENAVAVGAGVIACTDPKCDDIEGSVISAATVTAGDATIKAPKAGETFTVPVVITNNPGVVGVTLSVETSANVSLTDASVDGTLFAGAYMEYVNDIVLNRGDNPDGNLTEDGTIVYLTLTALETMNEGDTFTVKVSVTDTADTDLETPVVLYSDYTKEYTVIARDPVIEFNTLSFTVGNTMSFNVNVKFTPNSVPFDTNKAKLTVEMLDENNEYVVLGEETVTAEKDADGTYYFEFTVDGIPMAYLANSLKVRFTTVDAECELEATEDQMMDSEGNLVPISFKNYSEYLKATGENETLSNLLDTMLNYTAAVQQYKGYNTDSLANKDIENNIKSIKDYSDADWSKYTAAKRGMTSNAKATVKFTGSKLLMSSDKTGFRFVFTVEDGVNVGSLTLKVKCNDEIVAEISGSDFAEQGDGKYHADFDGYAPNEFDTQIKVAVFEDGTQVSNIAYDSIPGVAKAVARNEKYESLCPVLSGMLAYCDAVQDYMKSTNN